MLGFSDQSLTGLWLRLSRRGGMQFLSHTPVLLAVMIGVTRQAGFTPGQRVRVVVEHGRMIITAD